MTIEIDVATLTLASGKHSRDSGEGCMLEWVAYVAEGVVLILSSIMFGLLVWCFSRAIRLYAQSRQELATA